MYMLGGLKPSLEIGAKNKDEAGKDILNLKSFDLSLEIGFGSDIFFQLFKLSPEIRYSRGLINLLKTNELLGLQLLTMHNIFFMNELMSFIRDAVEKDRLEEAEKEWYYRN